jgi:hypothetical protein
VTVLASDAQGHSGSTSAVVTVGAAPAPPPPPPPTPTPAPPALSASLTCTLATHPAPTACNVVATFGGTALPSGRISKVDWDWGDGLSDLAAGPAQAHPYLLPGTYTVFAVVTLTMPTPDGKSTVTTSKVVVIP